jgi:hypothetical protein
MMSPEVVGEVTSNFCQMSQTAPESTLPQSYMPPHVEHCAASYLQSLLATRSGVLHWFT